MKSKITKRNKLKNPKGITLIALVLTIIVLLILAGVSIATLTGDNGILTKAAQTKEANRLGILEEELRLWQIDNFAEDYISTGKESQTELLNRLEQDGTITAEERQKLANGETITIYGKQISLTNYTAETTAGNKVANLTNASNEVIGIKVSDGAGKVIPIPDGFYYVGGTSSSGVVISDDPQDQNKYAGKADVGTDLEGNQFVWVPVDGTTLTYSSHEYETEEANDLSGSTADTGNGKWKTYYYRNYSDWTDTGVNTESVEKYGGYYIGRYEAGWSDQIADGDTYETSSTKNSTTTIESKTPIIKAGASSWNFISQANAKMVSEKMYNDSSSVTSGLVDSYAWDTACEFIAQDESDKEAFWGDSTSYGNYYNSSATVESTTYALHRYSDVSTAGTEAGKSSAWTKYSPIYKKGKLILGNISVSASNTANRELYASLFPLDSYDDTNYSNHGLRKEIATGSLEATKLKNIYDLAGNMHEWTTETGKHDDSSSSSTFAVHRGGGLSNGGSFAPVVYRFGGSSTSDTSASFGFRVVLYVK